MGRALRMPEFDDNGLLKSPGEWSENLAQAIALQDGIGELTEEHWEIIKRMRTDFVLFGTALSVRRLSLGQPLEKEQVHELFHSYLEVWRVSGLPNPGDRARDYLERV